MSGIPRLIFRARSGTLIRPRRGAPRTKGKTVTTFTNKTTITLSLTLTIAAGLCATMLAAPPANATEKSTVSGAITGTQELDIQAADLEQGLALIEQIPDSVLAAGDAATHEWLRENHPELLSGSRADILGCAGAIAWLIASTAIPAAKILKIKRLINSLGGVSKAVQLFWGATFKWEKIQALGGAAAALGAELLGIAAVKQKCFS